MKNIDVCYSCEYMVKYSDSSASFNGVKTKTLSVNLESLVSTIKQLDISAIPVAISISGRVEEDDYSGTVDLIGPFEVVITFEDKSSISLNDYYGNAYPELEKQLHYLSQLQSLWGNEIIDQEKRIAEYRKNL
jgi:hypothetical protein